MASVINESSRILVNELEKHGVLYDAFIASIKSAIKDSEDINIVKNEDNLNKLSCHILKRLIGEE